MPFIPTVYRGSLQDEFRFSIVRYLPVLA